MKYAYYPGCSGETTSKEYEQSVREVCRVLGIELADLPDWNCCGASSGHSTDYWLSHALPARNLAIGEGQDLDIAVSCPACFLRLKSAEHEFKREASLKKQLVELINMPYEAKREVRHLLDIVANTVGIEAIREKVRNPLSGLRLVAYYGCYLVRPPELTGFDDPENPQTMDRLMKALGAEVLDWSGKVDCCGGSLSLTNRDLVAKMVAKICDAADGVGAEAIVTACGLCHANLESRQTGKNALPVFYFTELIGLAMGCDTRSWFQKHLIRPFALLRKHGLLSNN